jgi:hypothetical protein
MVVIKGQVTNILKMSQIDQIIRLVKVNMRNEWFTVANLSQKSLVSNFFKSADLALSDF